MKNEKRYRFISWNVNGIRSAVKHGFIEFIMRTQVDIYALQEVRDPSFHLPLELAQLGYKIFPFPAKKRGYAGTLILSKIEPINAIFGLEDDEFDDEGRLITLEFDNFCLLDAYFPNSQPGLTRINYKLRYDRKIRNFVNELNMKKPIVLTGDFNVAHKEIDIARPKENTGNPGFTNEEREWFSEILSDGYIETFRYLHPNEVKYTWWSYRYNAREKNIGWRIDYFLVSKSLALMISEADILTNVRGSDHAPISLTIKQR